MAETAGTSYGLLAEFGSAEELVASARKAYEDGYRDLDAYSPFPIEGLDEAIGFNDNRIPWFAFFGGLLGGGLAFYMQTYATVFHYPLNVGGRPLFSWPAYIPVTFELTVLFSGLTAVISMIILNGLPRLNHPLFNVPRFGAASNDRFFLFIGARDPRFHADKTGHFLSNLGSAEITHVEE